MGLFSNIVSFFTGGSSGSNSSQSNNSQKTTTTKTTTTTTTTKTTTTNTNSGGTTKKTNNPSNSNPVSTFVNNVTNFASDAVETVTNFASDTVETVSTTLSDIGNSVNQALKSTGTAGTATGDTTTASPRSNSEVNEKYQKNAASSEKTVVEHSSSPTYTPPADTVPKTATQTTSPRSNSEVNSKYETPTAEEVKETISNPKTTASNPEAEFYSNKVVDTGTPTTANTHQESISEIYDNTIIAWRDNQYDKAVDEIINENPTGALASGVPAILADIAAPLDALGVTLKIFDIVAGTNENAMAQTSDAELVAGGIDAAITSIPIVGTAIKTTANVLGVGTKVAAKTTKTAAETTLKGAMQDAGTVFTKTADDTPITTPKKTTSPTAATAAKPADDVAEAIAKRDAKIDTAVSVASPIAAVLGTAATLTLEDESEYQPEPVPEQATENPTKFTMTRTKPTVEVDKEYGMWGIGDVLGGNGVGYDFQSDFLVAESAPINTEVDRIIENYAIPAIIAGIIVAALGATYAALSKGGKTNG